MEKLPQVPQGNGEASSVVGNPQSEIQDYITESVVESNM